jgi:hypothetical protein
MSGSGKGKALLRDMFDADATSSTCVRGRSRRNPRPFLFSGPE